MRAAICREFGKPLAVEEVSLRSPGTGEVGVTIEACAVCHSDISYIRGDWGGHLPSVFGHEAVGRVDSVGRGVAEYAEGDRVLVTLLRACGQCRCCILGSPAICETAVDPHATPLRTGAGEVLFQGLRTGAFAERAVIDRSQLAPIPDDIPAASACLLSCGVITGVGAAVNSAGIGAGSAVAVIGAGGVGLNAIQGAAICGASRIIALDISEAKLEDARQFGATDGVLASIEKPHRRVRDMTGGRGVDFALITVGSTDACELALRCLCHGGKAILVGMPPSGAKTSFEPVILAGLGQSMIGSKMGDALLLRDIPWLVDLYRQGRLKLDELVTGRFPLDGINDAIASALAGDASRNVIVF